ncbi:MAG: hypothetical protein HKN58_07995, partial [Xanthomonadales bacterium]|nr:hypothetical protein [Xanthomonadales bacterium]
MKSLPRSAGGAGYARSERYHRWRKTLDALTRRLISLGGISVILAVVLILFYLVYVVIPLFLPASAERESLGQRAEWAGQQVLYSAVEEQLEVGLRVNTDGTAEFYRLEGLGRVSTQRLLPEGQRLVAATEASQGNGAIAVASESGDYLVFRHRYETNFDDGVALRTVVPTIEYPYGQVWRPLTNGEQITSLAVSDGDDAVVIAAAVPGALRIEISTKQENFLTGEVSLTPRRLEAETSYTATGLGISGNHQWLYVSDHQGRVHMYRLRDLQEVQAAQATDRPITSLGMLLGGISVLAGDDAGGIAQLFPVRDDENQYSLELVRRFDALGAPIVRIIPEYRRKGFVAFAENGELGVYHSTAGQQ